MIWKISDIVVLIITAALVLNILVVLTVLFRKIFEEVLGIQKWNQLLKLLILYSFLPMPVLVGAILYRLTVLKSYPMEMAGEGEVWQLRILGNKTLSTGADLGNHIVFRVLLAVWIAGVLWFMMKDYLYNQKTLFKLRNCSTVNKREYLLKLKQIKRKLNINHSLTLLTSSIIPSPFMTGIFHNRIYLPEIELSEQETSFLLEHELNHCKSSDYSYRRLMFFLSSLYWFNPLVRVMADYFVEINELACDEKVLQGKDKEEKKSYVHLIVRMAERNLQMEHEVAFADDSEDSLERRVRYIMSKRKRTNRIAATVLTILMVLTYSFSTVAASRAVSSVQDKLARKIEDANSMEAEPQQITYYIEYTETDPDFAERIKLSRKNITTRNIAWIDEDLVGKEDISITTMFLNSGDEILFAVRANNSEDKFKIGLIDENGKKTYVFSSKGEVEHTFTIKKSGTYTIFAAGTTDESIHISGSFTKFDR